MEWYIGVELVKSRLIYVFILYQIDANLLIVVLKLRIISLLVVNAE